MKNWSSAVFAAAALMILPLAITACDRKTETKETKIIKEPAPAPVHDTTVIREPAPVIHETTVIREPAPVIHETVEEHHDHDGR